MNEVERVQGQLQVLSLRVRQLEQLLRLPRREQEDVAAARRICEEVGLDAHILLEPVELGPGYNQQQVGLAKALRTRGWSASRISRVLCCSERTIERWTDTHR